MPSPAIVPPHMMPNATYLSPTGSTGPARKNSPDSQAQGGRLDGFEGPRSVHEPLQKQVLRFIAGSIELRRPRFSGYQERKQTSSACP